MRIGKNEVHNCFKAECPICHQSGSIQLFLNNKHEVRYARTRHTNLAKESKKPQYTYCKINDKEALKTLLSKQITSLTTSTPLGQDGQAHGFDSLDTQLRGCVGQHAKPWASSSARIEHQT